MSTILYVCVGVQTLTHTGCFILCEFSLALIYNSHNYCSLTIIQVTEGYTNTCSLNPIVKCIITMADCLSQLLLCKLPSCTPLKPSPCSSAPLSIMCNKTYNQLLLLKNS